MDSVRTSIIGRPRPRLRDRHAAGSSTDGYTLIREEPYKAELIDRKGWSGLIEVMAETSKWVAWYNQSRLHSAINYRPPVEVHSEWINQSGTEPAAA